MMGRPRGFDDQQVLEAALELFWEKGYEACSLSDLTAAMKLQKASLYNAFGDKKSLFLAALERYQADALAALESDLKTGSVKAALRRWFDEVVDYLHSPEGSKGCLCFNAATEMAPHDAEVASSVQGHIKQMQKLLVQALKRGQTSGELARRLDTETLAWNFINGMAGLQVVAKCRPPRKVLAGIAQSLLASLD